MLGFLIYLPSLAYIPHFAFLMACAWMFIVRHKMLSKNRITGYLEDRVQKNNLFLLLGFILLTIVNMLMHVDEVDTWKQSLPYTVLIIGSYLLSFGFKKEDALMILAFISLEVFVGGIEFMRGVSSIFTSHPMYIEFPDNALLYYKRVMGLSDSSSALAVKVFAGFILLRIFRISGVIRYMFTGILLLGVVLTFNRSVLVSIVLYWMLLFLEPLWNNYQQISVKSRMSFLPVLILGPLVGLMMFWEQVVGQFTRNRGTIELSGREKIWEAFGSFISEHVWLGNGSYKFLWEGFHAHNSYLQIIATHGLPIAALLIFIVLYNTRKSNMVIVLPILVYSTTQYGVFWGFSLLDILLFYVLFKHDQLNRSYNEDRLFSFLGRPSAKSDYHNNIS